jgi:hypothetical protein
MEMEQQPTAQARAEPWAAGRRAEAKDLSDTIAIVLAITIAALFVSVLLNTIAFPRGTHPDAGPVGPRSVSISPSLQCAPCEFRS